jgi:hypothetical protein
VPVRLPKAQAARKVSNDLSITCRGGIAVVWLGTKDNKFYALKQFPKVAGK